MVEELEEAEDSRLAENTVLNRGKKRMNERIYVTRRVAGTNISSSSTVVLEGNCESVDDSFIVIIMPLLVDRLWEKGEQINLLRLADKGSRAYVGPG